MRSSLYSTLLILLCWLVAGMANAEDSATWMKEDIEVFREKFLAVDRSFTPQARAYANARLSQLERTTASVSPVEFAVELCRIAALADNAHTGCLPNWLGREICRQWAVIDGGGSIGCPTHAPDKEIPDFNSVPIAFRPFGEEFHVIGIEETNAELLGARLITVDGRPIEDLRDTLRSFAGGTIASRDSKAAGILASPEQLHAVGLARRNDSVTYGLRSRDGRVLVQTLDTSDVSAESAAMRWAPDADRATWALRDRHEAFRYRDAPELESLVVQLRQNVDTQNRRLADFLNEVEVLRAKLGRANVVLDMRFNGGGNLMLTRDFMAQWPSRVPGRFFVLTSTQTFSAAIASIAYLKQAGAERVLIIGEPVGDRLMFFSDGRPVQLPHSGRFFLPAPVRMDYRNGCRDYDDCFMGVAQPGRPTAPLPPSLSSVERMPILVDSLDPDVLVRWTIDSWLKGTDPMLDAIAKVVAQQ